MLGSEGLSCVVSRMLTNWHARCGSVTWLLLRIALVFAGHNRKRVRCRGAEDFP